MKYFYCDSCFLITFYQDGNLGILSQYKDLFYISKTQLDGELLYPSDLSNEIKKSITIIEEDRDEILQKTMEFFSMYQTLSRFDCLCMAYSSVDGYCLITDDKALTKKCEIHGIETKTSRQIVIEFKTGGDSYE